VRVLAALAAILLGACGGPPEGSSTSPDDVVQGVDDESDEEVGEAEIGIDQPASPVEATEDEFGGEPRDCDSDGDGAEDAAEFQVFGNEAEMFGTIDSSTPCRVVELFTTYPDVDTIVMIDVPGSADDDANLEAATIVHEREITIVVVADGPGVASGGTDFFAAGEIRIVESGAMVGVHSWAGDDVEGADLPRDDPEHQQYLDFYAQIGIPSDFYWFTLEAAPASDIHYMTDEELLRFEIATDIEPP
jgi:hypothetical protein